MPGNWHVRFGGGPYGKGPANCGHLAIRPTQPFAHHRLFGPTVHQIATDRRYMWRPGRSRQITRGPCQVVLKSADRRILSMALTMKGSRNMP